MKTQNVSVSDKWYKTEVCEILGIEYPIFLGAMVWVSNWKLASAVSNAGGLGVLAGGSILSEDELREEIKRVREATDRPFGVNIPIMNPLSEQLVNVCIEEKIPVIITSAGNPKTYAEKIKSSGAKFVHVVATPRQGKKAEECGADIIVAEGIEAGGHDSPFEITTFVLIQKITEIVRVPVVAAGGIATGKSMVAAFALGARGVQMGTRFILTKECEVHPNFKDKLLQATEEDTVLTGRSIKKPVRCIKNKLAEEILELERKGVSEMELLNHIGPGRSRLASVEGDVENGTVMCGQCVGLVNEIKSVSEVIKEMIEEGTKTLQRLINI